MPALADGTPTSLNVLIRRARLTPEDTVLVRHADPKANDTRLFNGWRTSDPDFETYYRLQNPRTKPAFEDGRTVLQFIKVPPQFVAKQNARTLFIGAWRCIGRPVPAGTDDVDPYRRENGADYGYVRYPRDRFFMISEMDEFVGRLLIDWGPSERAWRQWAYRRDKTVVSMLDDPLGPFPRSQPPGEAA
ncbi:hypothetical protein [Azospirillum argentinense]|uniref:Uncharacterized protein n=1 Tax=Azospirillum brasilense TaxID=192 RepID=A0A4D8QE41_AZOBR|nr:hypothetical protein [Azospirillum argentinense]QCO07501.1 hypothetical protein D3867_37085 [Azospirillum argentinense]